jgi:hypothetical protein
MKVCNTCNTAIEDNCSFCPNCGASTPANHPAYLWNIQKEPISVGGWIGRSLIPMIPLVGGIVYLVMLFIWSGDVRKEDTFRNWAKAQLIVMAVVFVLTIIGVVLCLTVFSDLLRSL